MPSSRHHLPQHLLDLWVVFRASDLPEHCVGMEIDGVDLSALDASTTGCVAAFVRNGCALDPDRTRMLRLCVEQARHVAPQLEGTGRVYFERLRAVAEAVYLELHGKQ